MASRIDEFGTPDAYNHYAVGWAHAMDTPYQWTKQVASHWGGTRNGTIVHWPTGIKAKGELRNQFHHVIDVAPTVLEAAGLPEPTSVNGVQQTPMEGVSMLYASTTPARTSATRRSTSRCSATAASTTRAGRRSPGTHPLGGRAELPAFDDDVWELYAPTRLDAGARPAAEQPDKLPSCSGSSRSRRASTTSCRSTTAASSASTPTSPDGRSSISGNSQMLFGGMGRLNENSVLNIKNKSHAVTAEIDVPEGGRGCDGRAGRRLRRLESLCEGGQARVLLQPLRPPALQDPGRDRVPPGSTRCGWSSPTTAEGSPRAET